MCPRAFSSQSLLNFNVLLRVPQLLYKKHACSVALIALQHDLLILRRASARAEGLHLLRQSAQVLVFAVDAVDDGHRSAEFSCLHTNSNALLFLADFAAYTNLSRKPACWTNIRHCTQGDKHKWRYIRLSTLYSRTKLEPDLIV